MTRSELTATCASLGWSKRHLARVLGLPETTVLGWGGKGRAVPKDVALWLDRYARWCRIGLHNQPPPGRDKR